MGHQFPLEHKLRGYVYPQVWFMWVKLANNEGTQVRKCKVDHERLYRSAVADMTTEPLFFTPRRALQSNAGTQRTEKSPLFSGVCRPLNPNRCKIFL